MTDNETIITFKDVNFAYGEIQILKGLTFSIKRGEYLGVIGPNGGGKTTLLKILLGLIDPTGGTIEIFGKDIHRFTEWYRIGYVPQRAQEVEASFPATVEEVVRSGRTARKGIGHRFDHRDQLLVEDAMELTQVKKYRNTRIGALSGGERQRVFIARALAGEPAVLILDEPTTGLHFHDIKQLLAVLTRLRDHGNTVIIVEHNLDVIKTADWIIDLGPEGGDKGGELIACGTPEEVVKLKRGYTAEYLVKYLN